MSFFCILCLANIGISRQASVISVEKNPIAVLLGIGYFIDIKDRALAKRLLRWIYNLLNTVSIEIVAVPVFQFASLGKLLADHVHVIQGTNRVRRFALQHLVTFDNLCPDLVFKQ